ncbi:MAG: hypothetical protein HYX42_04160 [Polaromonas sp.]|uniref:hypothetical protein n=1 Tax=Polaromonas sp. TaxID=1869339 RepID=UPI0025EE54FF|nr:hypothetical protein [Polaromonas sp.]MBI2725424.1 hypothetical protein [Polaromonas sp.]
MKTIAIVALFCAGSAMAQVYVKPHVTKDGTFVDGHVRTAPNNTNLDNYSTKGNSNPYTGQQGTVQPNYFPQPTYQPPQPRQQQCGYTAAGQYVCR